MTPQQILRTVSHLASIPQKRLRSHDRYPDIAQARDLCALLLRTQLGLSLPRIGEILGGRHHTTISVAVRRADRRVRERTEPYYELAIRILDHESAWDSPMNPSIHLH